MDTITTETVNVTQCQGLQPGVWRELSNEAYHCDRSAISSSGLKRILRSPAHFNMAPDEEAESSASLAFGTAFHMALLEPARYAETYRTRPAIDRRSKAGKARAMAIDEALADKVVVSADWLDEIEKMVASARQHRQVRAMLQRGEAELSHVWQDADAMCKVRPDWLNDEAIWDVKTCVDASREGFSKACARYGYALSAAFYQDGVKQLTGVTLPFRFVACEKGAPYAVAVYEASESFMTAGRKQFREALRTLRRCRERGEWPAYQPEGKIEYMDLPRWANA
jgi:PDDEXK-like domain of unknown function (DUF3799)